jgi:hypothetical protein
MRETSYSKSCSAVCLIEKARVTIFNRPDEKTLVTADSGFHLDVTAPGCL